MTLQATAGPTATEGYFRLVGQALGDRRQGRLRHQMAFQYPAIDFKGRSVLDVGGGDGIHSFYAAARGASKVVNLEPESDGSTAGVTNQFGRWKTALGASNVQLNLGTFQSFDPQGQTFDIVLIQDAINHLDEDACITVRTESFKPRQLRKRVQETRRARQEGRNAAFQRLQFPQLVSGARDVEPVRSGDRMAQASTARSLDIDARRCGLLSGEQALVDAGASWIARASFVWQWGGKLFLHQSLRGHHDAPVRTKPTTGCCRNSGGGAQTPCSLRSTIAPDAFYFYKI